jgi:hypothetical protein
MGKFPSSNLDLRRVSLPEPRRDRLLAAFLDPQLTGVGRVEPLGDATVVYWLVTTEDRGRDAHC